MSEFLTINTAPEKVKKELVPYQVFSDGSPSLSFKPDNITIEDIMHPQMQEMIERLKLTMKVYNGLGLSATQCGMNARVFVMGSDVFQMVCINPKIVETFGEMERLKEGCLSFPGMYLSIPRFKKIAVEFQNQNGETINTEFEGISAQVYQHELDHMNGMCYTEHVGPLAIKMAKQKQAKLIKTIVRKSK
jgi:peptide deformylase